MSALKISSSDLFAGLSVAGLLLPEAVAYASIAGLEPQHGIFAAIAGLTTYAIFGRSRFAIVTPTSSSAAILAAATASVVAGSSPQDVPALATGAVLLAGIFFILAGVLRLGALAQFISRPVLRGFAFGLSATIAIRQLPQLTGVKIPAAETLQSLALVLRQVGDMHAENMAMGGGALALLLIARGLPRIPAAFLLLSAGIAASFVTDFGAHHVALVGRIDVANVAAGLPALPREAWLKLAQVALPLVLIVYAESWGAMRNLALRHGETLEANRELFALGCANVASGLFRGIPVGAGFSASSANEAAGAASRLAGVFAAICMSIFVAFFGPLVARIPEPILAAVVIAAVAHSLNPSPIARLWRLDRDQYVAMTAAVGVLVLGVVDGMLLAVVLSVAATLNRLAHPRVERLGRLPESHAFVDVLVHADAETDPAILVLRPTEPLFFANAESVFAQIDTDLQPDEPIRVVVLSLEESSDLDSTAIEVLGEFDARCSRRNRLLLLARSKQHVRDALERAQSPLAHSDRSFWSVDEAFDAALDFTKRNAPTRWAGV